MVLETEELTGVDDFDRKAVNDPDALRTRDCACGHPMAIKVGLDDRGNLSEIQCVQGTYLREGGREFPVASYANGKYNQFGKFIYCRQCRRRRAWSTFKEQ